ncbi:MAG: Cell division protein FtsW [Candidatus Kapaibacterium sp.]|nr:MAG: Cell division protein FtsW [Candidatus Kapabacteria bacterium]
MSMEVKVGAKKSFLRTVDKKLLASVLFLILIGIYSIFSNYLNSETLIPFQKHLTYVSWGIILMFAVAFMPEQWIRSIAFPFYIITTLLLIAVLIFGVEINGTKGWLRIAGYSFQPSEFAKLAVILASSAFLSIPGVSLKNIRGLGTLFVIFLLPLIFIVLQPDFGTAIILLTIFWGILFWSDFNLNILLALLGFPFVLLFYLKGIFEFIVVLTIFSALIFYVNKRKFVVSIITIALVVVLSLGTKDLINHLPKHQQDRISAFVDPSRSPLKESYNMIQSILAVGSGGLFGKGPFSGTQTQLKYVYAQSSDFVFSIPAEEFGFVGSVAIVIAFFVLISRVVRIGTETGSPFLRYIILSYATLLFVHFAENLGMAMGLFPVMGIPLPFVSSGGSFFLVNSFLVGVALNAYRKKFKDV